MHAEVGRNAGTRGHGGERDDGDHGGSLESAVGVHLPHELLREKSNDVLHSGAERVSLLPREPSRGEGRKNHQDEKGSCHQKHDQIPYLHDPETQAATGGQ